MKRRDWSAAERLAHTLIRLGEDLRDPLVASTGYFCLAQARSFQGRHAAAIESLHEGLGAAEETGRFDVMKPWRLMLVQEHRTLGALEEAEHWLRTLRDHAPDAPELPFQQAAQSWYAGQLAEAESGFSGILARAPDDFAALAARGQVRAELGRFAEALPDLNKALDLLLATGISEGIAYVQSGMGLALAGLQRDAEADEAFEISASLAPDNAWLHFNQGLVAFWRHDVDSATERLTTAIQKTNPPLSPPKRAQAREMLAELESS